MNKERFVLPTHRIRFLVPMRLLRNLRSVWKVNTHMRSKISVSLMKKWLRSAAMNVYIYWSYLYICSGYLRRGRSLWLTVNFRLTVSHASGRSTDLHTMSTMPNVCNSSTNEEITLLVFKEDSSMLHDLGYKKYKLDLESCQTFHTSCPQIWKSRCGHVGKVISTQCCI